MSISRRSFIAASGAAALATAGASAAFAEDAPTAASPAYNQPSWAVKPEPIAEDQIVETIETEVLILGAGNAGCSAACSAVENGAKVLVCEKTAQVNGRGGVVGACNSRLNAALGCEIEPVAAQYRSSLEASFITRISAISEISGASKLSITERIFASSLYAGIIINTSFFFDSTFDIINLGYPFP